MWNIRKIISKGDYQYALVPEHPKATKNGYVLMHRIVIENNLKRLLNDNEIVHHIDGNKKNNNIENLQVMESKAHNKMHGLENGRMHVKLKCPNCGKIFDIPKNASFLQKPSKYNCTCCSSRCRGIFYRKIQTNGLTHIMENAISENLLAEYRRFYIDEDNSEETTLYGFRRDYTHSTCDGEDIVQTTTI